ncbi:MULTISPECIES: flagellar protein FlgN [Clostridium]|uniref:flagellar protein FlgN n=1 Tax=Clostridium TaxID=1485 RepID=UPI000824E177|nr:MULTISPECIES: flagellar protein FlgN [Clostridium]
MKKMLNELMLKEYDALNELIVLLEKQYNLCINENAFELEAVAKDIEKSSITIGKYELERRELTGSKSVKLIIEELNDKELNDNFLKLKNIILKVKSQNEINQSLLKRRLMFTNKVLRIFNPDRGAKVYNNYGKVNK